MCGIIAFIPSNTKNKKTGKQIIEQYQRQHSRGTRGFGLISITDKNVVIDRATEPTKIILDTYMSEAPIKVFHHRMPTSTENEIEQTHPFTVSHDELKYDWKFIHNGVISNSQTLMKKHTEELGYTYHSYDKTATKSHIYQSFNDSEALAIELARYFEGLSPEIGTLGSVAFIGVKVSKKSQKPLEIIWGRNDRNPLELVQTKDGILIASTIFHEDAESIPDFVFEVIDLKEYFKNKKTNIIKLIKQGDLTFATPPPLPTYTAPAVGFGRTNVLPAGTSKPITQQDIFDDQDDEPETHLSKRERAFQTMAERVIDDVTDDIYEFFSNLAEGDVDDEVITAIASNLNDTLLEKKENALAKIRPFFDKLEEQELSNLIDYETQQIETDPNYVDEEEITNFSLSERLENSTRRFKQIME